MLVMWCVAMGRRAWSVSETRFADDGGVLGGELDVPPLLRPAIGPLFLYPV